MKFTATVAGRSYDIQVDHDCLIRVNGYAVYVDMEQIGSLPVYVVALDEETHLAFVSEADGHYRVELAGNSYPTLVQRQHPLQLCTGRESSEANQGPWTVGAPLPGKLVSLCVEAGERCEAGQTVAVVESMKMMMELKVPRAGIVAFVHGPPGRDVALEEPLVSFRADSPWTSPGESGHSTATGPASPGPLGLDSTS